MDWGLSQPEKEEVKHSAQQLSIILCVWAYCEISTSPTTQIFLYYIVFDGGVALAGLAAPASESA